LILDDQEVLALLTDELSQFKLNACCFGGAVALFSATGVQVMSALNIILVQTRVDSIAFGGEGSETYFEPFFQSLVFLE
jgi:hypothetical protein